MIALPVTLPADGIDIRAELAAHQTELVELALARTSGDQKQAARLLRVSPLELTRMQARVAALARVPDPVLKRALEPPPPKKPTLPPRVPLSELPRVSGGLERISSAIICRLSAEGWAPRQIGDRLGVNPFVVEKVLRIQREKTQVRKCGPVPRPSSMPMPTSMPTAERERA